jgi:hypothetical protein
MMQKFTGTKEWMAEHIYTALRGSMTYRSNCGAQNTIANTKGTLGTVSMREHQLHLVISFLPLLPTESSPD